MTDFNRIKDFTESQKIRKITVLKKYMLDAIDNDQDVKRYMRYLTTTPLSKKGVGYDGAVVVQNDLVQSMKYDSSEGEKVLFAGGFDPYMETIVQNYIFVQHQRSRITDDGTNIITFMVYILVPEKYNELKNYGEERTYQIAESICQILDCHTIENDEIVDIVGNTKIEIYGDVVEQRLTKTKDIIMITLPIRIVSSTLRVWNE